MKEVQLKLLREDLLYASLKLLYITDQPIDKNGMIKVNYQYANEIINNLQLIALSIYDYTE